MVQKGKSPTRKGALRAGRASPSESALLLVNPNELFLSKITEKLEICRPAFNV